MKLYYLLLAISFLFSCSSNDENETINNDFDLPENVRFMHKFNNGDRGILHYENGRLIKGVGNSSAEQPFYYEAFQVEYYENDKVKRVIHSKESANIPKPVNFQFDLLDGTHNNIVIYEYFYHNNRLVGIGNSLHYLYEFYYDSSGRIIAEIRNNGFNVQQTRFYYDNQGNLDTFLITHSSEPNDVVSGKIILDNQINPNFILWKKFSFYFPKDVSSITNFNYPYFKNNLIVMYNGSDVFQHATMSYGNDYPITYSWMGNHNQLVISYLND